MKRRLLIVLALAALVSYFNAVARAFRGVPPYEAAEAYIVSSAQLAELFGASVRPPRYPLAHIDHAAERAWYSGRLRSETGSGTVRLTLQRLDDDDWRVVEARFRQRDAVTALDAVKATTLREARARLWRAHALAQNGMLEEARTELTTAMEEVPRYGGAYYERARLHRAMGDSAAAYADLRSACTLHQRQACAVLGVEVP